MSAARSRLGVWLLRALAAVFGAAALFHLAAMVWPNLGEPSPVWRHALFVFINAGFAAAFVFQPRGLRLAFGALCIQQLWSHGSQAVELSRSEGRVDWASALVLLGLPLAWAAVAWAARPDRAG